MRLGFVAKPLARPELKSHDSRRWQNGPHLRVSLAYLRDVFGYLTAAGITMYRMSSELAPYATHPDMPQFHRQVAESLTELAEVGAQARQAGVRLSFHPGQHIVLNSPDDEQAARSAEDLVVQSSILDAMGAGREGVVVVHAGGVYGDLTSARQRFVHRYLALPQGVRERLVLENDDTRFGVIDVLWIHERTGIPLIFDNLHHRLQNPDGRPQAEAIAACLRTWPQGVRPKVHFSSPRTEWVVEERAEGQPPAVRRPRWSYHSDYVNPFEFIDFLRSVNGTGVSPKAEFDVMLEVRAKDLALLQLRADLARFAPDLAARLEPGILKS
jgi:UV DNA damage endonuclease